MYENVTIGLETVMSIKYINKLFLALYYFTGLYDMTVWFNCSVWNLADVPNLSYWWVSSICRVWDMRAFDSKMSDVSREWEDLCGNLIVLMSLLSYLHESFMMFYLVQSLVHGVHCSSFDHWAGVLESKIERSSKVYTEEQRPF